MPEPQPAASGDDQAGADKLIQVLCLAGGDRLEHRYLDSRSDQRGDVEDAGGRAAQPGGARQHGVARRWRDLIGTCVHDLTDVERIAAGQPEQVGCRELAAAGHHGHAIGGQRRERDAPGRALVGELAESLPERVARGQAFVAIGHDQQGRGEPDPPAEEPEQVDGCLVRPVHVLDHQHIEPPGLAHLA